MSRGRDGDANDFNFVQEIRETVKPLRAKSIGNDLGSIWILIEDADQYRVRRCGVQPRVVLP